MSELPVNSLKGYDTVIQVSQEAIQKQLGVLWGTKVKKPTPNGPRHLIDHEFNLHTMIDAKKKDGTVERRTSREGFDGYVNCPTIDFTGYAVGFDERYTTAKVSFTFTTADKVFKPVDIPKGKDHNSFFTFLEKYFDEELGAEQLRKVPININGWTISWKGIVAQKSIDDILDTIVGSTYVTSGVQKSLTVDSTIFSVSSIFCLFESGQVATSFEIINDKGERNNDVTLRTNMTTQLNVIFCPKPDAEGVPNPKNPFVLGYSISQSKPPIQQTSGTITHETPPYFLPKSVDLTITPGLTSTYSKGALNFCMLTHRLPGETEPTVNPLSTSQARAGRFEKSFFETLKMKANPGSTDAMIAFSSGIFYDNWIVKDVAKRFKVDYTSEFFAIDERKDQDNSLSKLCAFQSPIETTSNRKYTCVEGLTNKILRRREDVEDGFPVQLCDGFDIHFKKAISYTSTYADDNTIGNSLDDTKRRVKLKVTAVLDYVMEWNWHSSAVADLSGVTDVITGVFSGNLDEAARKHLAATTGDSKWKTFGTTYGTAILGYEFEIGADPKDRGKFQITGKKGLHKDSSGIRHLKGRGPTTRVENGDITGFSQYGLYTDIVWDANFSGLSNIIPIIRDKFEETTTELKSGLERLGDIFVNRISGVGENLVDRLAGTIIMPAGDVFMFKGLSTDENGNVYSGVTYDTPVGGTVELEGGYDVGRI
ncbi:hypothetical protein ABW20_dc0100609 [Dactylellina cionopaga]|nr:hypothetical protein ABW20_dc0100609 [Dactylellina cionopaga]